MTTFKKLLDGTVTFGVFIWIIIFPSIKAIPIDNALIGSETKTECKNGKAIDLAFILDGSGSIGKPTFEIQKRFVNMIIDRLTVGKNATRIAAVQFSDDPQLEFGLNTFLDSSSLKTAVSKLKYLTGTTRTGEALTFASNIFDSVRRDSLSGSFSDPVKVGVVITDGRAQDDVVAPSDALRSRGVILYAVGVTNHTDVDQLLQITGGAQQRVFTVESFEKLDQPFSALLAKELCKTTYQGNLLDITCGSDSISIQAKTKYPFEGNVFVKGFFHTKGCRVTADSYVANPTLIGISVPFNNCGVRRYRPLNPRGIFVETIVVFSFHPHFLTKVDQAIKVQCFYMEAVKTVQTDIEVSMFTEEFITRAVPMPVCYYSLRKNEPNGPLVRYAMIGDAIYHRWECVQQNEHEDIFGMLVHSCFVDDGQGNRVQLLDSKGCGLDIHLLTTPIYNESTGLRVAYQETHVFKFADKPVLQFQCQIMICTKVDDGCAGITPPDCSQSRARRSSPNFESLDVVSPQISIFEEDQGQKDFSKLNETNAYQYAYQSSQPCFDNRIVIHLIALTICVQFLILGCIFLYFKLR